MEDVLPSLCCNDRGKCFSLADSSFVTHLEYSIAYFEAIVLSYWDNILGPRLERVWIGPGDKQPKENCIRYVVSRTLHGELLRDSADNAIDSKLYIIKEHCMVCASFIFTGIAKSGECMFSLSFLLPYCQLHTHLWFHEVVELRVKKLIAKLRVFQYKDLLSARDMFSSCLPAFFSLMNSLQSQSIPEKIPFNDCIFADEHKKSFDELFLRRTITSFLQTYGSAVIIGKDIKTLNLLANTLALFLTPNERSRSRYAAEGYGYEQYEPDIFIQGLLKKNEEESFSSPGIVISQYPTTLVDVDHMTVQQTQPYHQHQVTRRQFMDIQLTLLWRGEESAPMYPSLGVFHESDDIAVLVQNFMTEMSVLPTVSDVKEVFIEQFNRLLNRKALALVKYAENVSYKGARKFGAVDLKNLKMDLCLTAEADFRIVLARADKLQPGIYSFVMGFTSPIKQVKEMLEAL